jgi:hypothetical protein
MKEIQRVIKNAAPTAAASSAPARAPSRCRYARVENFFSRVESGVKFLVIHFLSLSFWKKPLSRCLVFAEPGN